MHEVNVIWLNSRSHASSVAHTQCLHFPVLRNYDNLYSPVTTKGSNNKYTIYNSNK